MLGDFNAYAMEDPIRARKAAGFSEVVEEYDPDAASCEFSGRVGSLDHIFANAKAHELVSGAGIWDTNGSESVAMQYSRRDDGRRQPGNARADGANPCREPSG